MQSVKRASHDGMTKNSSSFSKGFSITFWHFLIFLELEYRQYLYTHNKEREINGFAPPACYIKIDDSKLNRDEFPAQKKKLQVNRVSKEYTIFYQAS